MYNIRDMLIISLVNITISDQFVCVMLKISLVDKHLFMRYANAFISVNKCKKSFLRDMLS